MTHFAVPALSQYIDLVYDVVINRVGAFEKIDAIITHELFKIYSLLSDRGLISEKGKKFFVELKDLPVGRKIQQVRLFNEMNSRDLITSRPYIRNFLNFLESIEIDRQSAHQTFNAFERILETNRPEANFLESGRIFRLLGHFHKNEVLASKSFA